MKRSEVALCTWALGLNDRGTALLGNTQVQTDASVNAIFGGGDQLHLTAVLPLHDALGRRRNRDHGNPSYLRTRRPPSR